MAAKRVRPRGISATATTVAMAMLSVIPPAATASPANPESALPWFLVILLTAALGLCLWLWRTRRAGRSGLPHRSGLPVELSPESLTTMLESMNYALICLDHQWRYTYVNQEAERLLRKPRQTLLGSVLWHQFPDLEGTRTEQQLRQAMQSRQNRTVEEEHYPPLDFWVDVHIHPWQDGLAVCFSDVTRRHHMLEKLRAHESRLQQSQEELTELLDARRALINSLPAHIALLDACGVIIDINEQWRRFALENGYTQLTMGVGCNYLEACDNAQGERAEEAPAVARGLRDILDGVQQSFTMEYPCHAPHRQRWFRMMANATRPPGDATAALNVVVMHVDITERVLAEQELSRLVREDRLTELLTREGFIEALNFHTVEHGWPGEAIVVMMDIISMRDINDAYGFEIGDQLLKMLARRLQDHVGENGLVGRTSGDEFMLMLHSDDGHSADELLAALAETLARPFELEEVRLNIEPRLGYTPLGESPRPVEDLLREGEAALFHHRETPQSSWVVYTRELGEQTRQRIELTREIRQALEDDQFEMHFQPKVELANGRIFGGEALVRWNHPERGMQSPGLFIPVAEKSQLIKPLGDWILRETCRLIRQWQDQGLQPPPVAVNISLVQFMPGNFPAKLQAILDEFQLTPDRLALEITESVFERESDWLLQQIHELHDMGVELSLDDFGTGYSSLLYLKQYPFDEIKVDQGFVRDIENDSYSLEIVRTVLGLARAFDARVVAEGIETAEVRDALLAEDCVIGQGYYYSKPVPASDFAALLQKRAPLPAN